MPLSSARAEGSAAEVLRRLPAVNTRRPRLEGDAGFIIGAFAAAGLRMPGGPETTALELLAGLEGQDVPVDAARPADLAFFSCRASDSDVQPVHLAILTRVDRQGRLEMLHLKRGRVRRLLASPGHPHERRSGSRLLNSYLRPVRPDDAPRAPHLAAECLLGLVRVPALNR